MIVASRGMPRREPTFSQRESNPLTLDSAGLRAPPKARHIKVIGLPPPPPASARLLPESPQPGGEEGQRQRCVCASLA